MKKFAALILAIVLVFAILVLGILLTIAYLLGDKHGVESMTIKRVGVAQAANAMQNDDFYSNYRENTLMIQGVVASTSTSQGDLVAEFKSDTTYKVRCDFGDNSPIVHAGTTITILSEGGSAERQPSGVLLKNCTLSSF